MIEDYKTSRELVHIFLKKLEDRVKPKNKRQPITDKETIKT
jgi:hypothetical protein